MTYQPLAEVVIFKDNLLHNLHYFQHLNPKWEIAPVIKSNAYGHGLVTVAKILEKEDISFFVVDSIHEARTLRNDGIKTPILIIGYTALHNIEQKDLKNMAYSIVSMGQLKEISVGLTRKRLFYLEIDTGMHRHGIPLAELNEVVKIIKTNKNIILEGVFSHLADADGPNEDPTLSQIEKWSGAVKIIKDNFQIKYWHLSATAGFRYNEKIEANVGRLGIGLYGIADNYADLRPTLELRTVVSGIREVGEGEGIGYNFTSTASSKMRIATIPIGYYGFELRVTVIIQLLKKGNCLSRTK